MPPALLAVHTTLATRDEARTLARVLVERRLAACAQITEIESVYRWQGQVQNEPEFRLLLKTTATAWPALAEAIRTLHPYELPAIYAVPVEAADPAYAAWVAEQCDGGAGPGSAPA